MMKLCVSRLLLFGMPNNADSTTTKVKKVNATGATRYHITLSDKIKSHCISYYIDGLVNPVLADIAILSQFNESGTQNQTIHFFLADVYPV